MWSDTLLVAERSHLLRLIVWGAGSVLAGSLLLVTLLVAARRGGGSDGAAAAAASPDGGAPSPLLLHFAIQTAAWGAIDLAIALAGWRGLAMRDVDGATRLDRLLWLNAGLDVGYVAVGVTLAVAGWLLGRRLGAVGAGLGVVVQGAALLVLDAKFIAVIAALAAA
jgi:hypothetical protein